MVDIKIKKGLDIPIQGTPSGKIQGITPSGEIAPLTSPSHISLNLEPFKEIKFRLLAKVGDVVKIGQPVAEDKDCPERVFVAPAAGFIKEIRRGLKRRILDIIIEVAKEETYQEHPQINIENTSREQLIKALMNGGYFAHIKKRPFNLLANPNSEPRSIFVKALESAPFTPSAEMQIEGHEQDFQYGLTALSKLTKGKVHLVYKKETASKALTHAKDVQTHQAEGPHPIANHSLHIQKIDPIKSYEDIVWTLNAHDVIGIGYYLRTGRYFTKRVISIAGPGILPEKTGYFLTRTGYPIAPLIAGRVQKGILRLISGDPLTGRKVEAQDFLGFNDFVFCAIAENTKREFMHFFRLGTKKYTFSKAYMTGHLDNSKREYALTTNQHGEPRAFIDSTLYDQVMPLNISTMLLVKSIMAEDFDLAEELGLLEVDSEDFALPTFVCPSKIEMMDIVKEGLTQYASEVLG